MLTADTIINHAHSPADTITLDENARHRRRIALTSDGGIPFLLNLAEARLLKHGEGVVLSDGRVIEIRADQSRFTKSARPMRSIMLCWHGRSAIGISLPRSKLIAF